MRSLNFEFLRPKWADLADLGAIAEQYTHPDPQSAVAKLRTFAEQIVLFIYHKHGLPKPYQNNLNDLLTTATFVQAVPRVICSKLHSLRIHGNKGAHGESVLVPTAVWLLQEAYDLGRWMHLNYAGGSKADCPSFVPPSATNGTQVEKKVRQEKLAILQRLAAQEAEMQRLLAEVEAARCKAQVAQETAAQLQAARVHGHQVADALAFDEEMTRRRLIDSLLVSAGWTVGANGASTEQVGQEVEVECQPTPSGKGKADYVLWGDNGKPFAVVESKKTAVDPEVGRTQAKCYADGLEKKYGQRPAIFYTNGYDIWLWNDAAGEPPRKLFGFYSQDSLEYLHYQRAHREPLTKTAPSPAIAGRMYQIEAIKRVVERFAAKHRQALIVQATGTGKTRVAVSLCDLLLRTKWAKRILFLCDRRELRKQAHNVAVFNKDTNRVILRNLMENGIRDATGTRVGKSIIFARNHNHAILLQNLFDEMYPQYGGKFCRVIDNYDPRAEELIDDFKGDGNNPDLTIAISVDMLDTGIDVPEIVNLVFAKPVYSYVKFWQMIGRGTRLCEDLFGPGRDKTHFLIFDHWKNFEFFDTKYKTAEPKQTKSLPQLVFEGRIRLAETALQSANTEAFETAIGLIARDIADLPDKTIAIRENWKEIQAVSRPGKLQQFDAATRAMLLHEIAPLMQWRNIGGSEVAHKFDLLVCRLQTEYLKHSSSFDDLKAELQGQLDDLRMNLSQVRAVAPAIVEARTADFWSGADVARLETLRLQLRGVMQYRQSPGGGGSLPPKVIDVKEDASLVERKKHVVKLEGLQLAAYRNRVERVLREFFAGNVTLQRIQKGQPVSEADLEALISLVLTQDPMLDLNDLVEYYPDCAGHLDLAIRSIIGLDAGEVHERFTAFVQAHGTLNSARLRFLDLLQNHIAKYGSIEVARLYEPPFTSLHTDSIDGLFPDEEQASSVIQIIESFQPPKEGTAVA